MEGLSDHARTGGSKGVSIGNRSAQHVKFTVINLASGMPPAQHVAGKTFATQQLKIRQRLRGKGFMHIDQG